MTDSKVADRMPDSLSRYMDREVDRIRKQERRLANEHHARWSREKAQRREDEQADLLARNDMLREDRRGS